MAEATGTRLTDPGDRHVRSFVIRAGRMTEAQKRAFEELGLLYLIPVDAQHLQHVDLDAAFGRHAEIVLEIGFGMGTSFVQMALDDPSRNYLGIEVHPPGVGSCMKLAHEAELKNLKIIHFDAFEVIKKCLAPQSISVLQIFFPDPWPKKRHVKRRLIDDEFIAMCEPLLKDGAQVRLAADWEDYALQMLEVMRRAKNFVNTAADGAFVPRPAWRPLTKFEQRGERLGHGVRDLVFEHVLPKKS